MRLTRRSWQRSPDAIKGVDLPTRIAPAEGYAQLGEFWQSMGTQIHWRQTVEFAHDVVLGNDTPSVVGRDDMPSGVLDPKATKPFTIDNRAGRIVRELLVGTPDPQTGEPRKTTREIAIRLMQPPKEEGSE
jgi:hypothetical protein